MQLLLFELIQVPFLRVSQSTAFFILKVHLFSTNTTLTTNHYHPQVRISIPQAIFHKYLGFESFLVSMPPSPHSVCSNLPAQQWSVPSRSVFLSLYFRHLVQLILLRPIRLRVSPSAHRLLFRPFLWLRFRVVWVLGFDRVRSSALLPLPLMRPTWFLPEANSE